MATIDFGIEFEVGILFVLFLFLFPVVFLYFIYQAIKMSVSKMFVFMIILFATLVLSISNLAWYKYVYETDYLGWLFGFYLSLIGLGLIILFSIIFSMSLNGTKVVEE